MPGCLKTIGQIALFLGGLLILLLGGGFVSGFFFDTVGPYLADNPQSQRTLGWTAGLVCALPMLILSVRRPPFVLGLVLFGAYLWLGLEALVLGFFPGNRRTTDAGLQNLSTWRQDAGEFRPALMQAFVGLSVLAFFVFYRRCKRDPHPGRRSEPTTP